MFACFGSVYVDENYFLFPNAKIMDLNNKNGISCISLMFDVFSRLTLNLNLVVTLFEKGKIQFLFQSFC